MPKNPRRNRAGDFSDGIIEADPLIGFHTGKTTSVVFPVLTPFLHRRKAVPRGEIAQAISLFLFFYLNLLRISSTMTCSAASFFAPSGIMMSAFRLLGSTNWSCMGFTVSLYCLMTLSRERPLLLTSRMILRRIRSSASVSTKMRKSISSRTSGSAKIMIPSRMITGLGRTVVVWSDRLCTA